jgi:heparanase 1
MDNAKLLHRTTFQCVDMQHNIKQDNIKRLSVPEKNMATSHLLVIAAAAVAIASVVRPQASGAEMSVSVNPSSMPRLGTIDARYQSYNVEMVEVTGGRFWKPYASPTQNSQSHSDKSNATDLYAYRPPIDLANPKLRKLSAALGPAYLRVSGTWANSTSFAYTDRASPPPGFHDVLSRQQWKGVVDFAAAVDAQIVTSIAISPGVRDASGAWTAEQARRLIDFTRSVGGRIAAAEFMNEPMIAAMGGAPKGYDAKAYARDFKLFERFVRQAAPGMIILGPGSGGETAASDSAARDGAEGSIASRDILQQIAGGIDVFSYHHYGALSQRCTGVAGTHEGLHQQALSEHWLASTDHALAFYRSLRDAFEPGKPIWLTETAEAACGGNPQASTFLDTFRYLEQLGRLAKAGVQVVMHNTLAASDYGLLDETTLTPRPNYWGALLWRKLMGSTVLDAGISIAAGQHVYAHCQRDRPGGVTLLVVNNDSNTHVLETPLAGKRYTLSAEPLESGDVKLNGRVLKLNEGDDISPLEGVAAAVGPVEFAPATITFLTLEGAANENCR